ncbi:MAG: DUF5050 domain-containing protein [Oscillospiraceae bacterium]|nr:DUF5050 domain-containing protein [Oscillospiraceae bacterium]
MRTASKKVKKKKNPAVVLLVLLLIAALITGAYYWVILFQPKSRGVVEPRFAAIPTDLTDNNLIGNIPENLLAGGFMASQDGWFYFANFKDGASLYMCRENGENMVKLTDFAVAGINVIADSIVFTSLEKCIAVRPDGVYTISFGDVRDLLRDIVFAQRVSYGGRLYSINGLRSGGSPELYVIDGEHIYFSPSLTRNGLFAIRESPLQEAEIHQISAGGDFPAPVPMSFEAYETYAGQDAGLRFREAAPESYEPYDGGISVVTEKMSALASFVAADGEVIVRHDVNGSQMLAEIRSTDAAKTSRILRVDLDSMQPTGEITGARSLHKTDSGYIFQHSDNFIYELLENGDIKPISIIPVLDFGMGQDQRLIAATGYGQYMVISKKQLYNPVFVLVSNIFPFFDVKRQNGWYNYINPEQSLTLTPPPPGFFLANGSYYRLFPDGTWLRGVTEAEWLNTTTSQAPIGSRDNFKPCAVFNAPWSRPGAEDYFDDFDDEIAPFSGEAADAAASPETSLDAAVMLLVGNRRIEEKYSPESVARLREFYGGDLNIDKAAEMGADKAAEAFELQFGAKPDTTELAEVLKDWVRNARYMPHDARISGNTADVPLTVTNVVDGQALTLALESEIKNGLARNPLMLLSSKDRQAEWAMGIFMEIAKNPAQYNAGNGNIHLSVRMKQAPGVGWVLEDPGELAGFLQRQIG